MLLTHLCLFQFLGGASAVQPAPGVPLAAIRCWAEPARAATFAGPARPAEWG